MDSNELDLRVSNQDRDAVIQRLQAAFLEGRLTVKRAENLN